MRRRDVVYKKVTEVCCGGAAVMRKTSDVASGFGKQDEAWPAGTLFCGFVCFSFVKPDTGSSR